MQINWIKVEGLFSVDEMYVNFDSLSPITRIRGVNYDTKPISSNGAGKSTLIEAIYWCLSGKTIRKATSISNTRTDKKCKVVMGVNGNVVIERHKLPPKLIVTIDGKEHMGESMEETKTWLLNYLNTSPELFLVSMVFGQANETGFLGCTPEQKRVIIQNFLNLQDIFEKRNKIKEKKTSALSDLKAKQLLLDEIGNNNVKVSNKIGEIKKSLNLIKKIFADPKAKKFIEQNSISQIQEKERNRSELISQESKLGSEIARINQELTYFNDEYQKLLKQKCNNCGAPINEELFNAAREKIKILTVEEGEKKKEREKLLKQFKEVDIPVTVQEFKQVELMKDYQNQKMVLEEQQKEHQNRYNDLSTEVIFLSKDIEYLKFWEKVFSETGVIQYIISNILDYFNNSINSYLKKLSNNSLALFFNEKLEEIIYMGNEETEFKNLSGGEKKRINLAVMLSLNDLLVFTGKNKSNVIFFDEVADSLDSIGVQGLADIIEELAETKKVMVISHNDELMSLLNDVSTDLLVEKRDGLTKCRFA